MLALNMAAALAVLAVRTPTVASRPQRPVVQTTVVTVTRAPSYRVWSDAEMRRELATAARLHQIAVQQQRARVSARAQAAVASRDDQRHPLGCTTATWRSTMTADEVWIDTRESSLDPYARNGRYWGLGQLGPSYAWTADPCQQLVDQRDYIAGRYGSEDVAVAFWRAHGWY